MGLWNKNDAASNTPYVAALSQLNVVANTANRTALFGNTTSGAFVPGAVTGLFGVSAAEMANTSGESKKVTHAGWNLRTVGTGPVVSFTIAAGGSGYSNNDTLRVSVGTVNATATLSTNSTGGLVSYTLTNPGAGFQTTSPAVTIANSTGGTTVAGTGATVTATAGGRAGRVTYETLVAMKSITGDATDDTQLPE